MCPLAVIDANEYKGRAMSAEKGRNRRVIGMMIASSLVAANAYAESSVTLYGVIDASIRYTTNQPTADGPKNLVALEEGAFNGGRWGIRGVEDLGAGTQVSFALENGFLYDTGKISQQGQLFGRQAWIGISNDTLGALKFGRLYGGAFNAFQQFDPFYTANYWEIGWQPLISGVRFDNTVEYSNRWAGLSLNAQYSAGEQAGKTSLGRSFQFGASYEAGQLVTAVGAMKSTDANGKDLVLWDIGAKYAINNFSVFGYYIDARRDAGFVVGSPGTTAPLANTSLIGNANTVAGPNTQTSLRHDRLGVVGVTYQAAPSWYFVASYLRDNVAGASRGASGIIQTSYLVAMYSLSKRTDVYLEADRSWLSGASVTDPNSPIGTFGGASTRTGVGLGMRHLF